ncbi:MAG TPA: hydrogenase maturation nickel metallochaperone HypA [Dehalococcoidia bacterium]|nr:hydrogenase maturation nickel metallochaperone HypA [Dehalococcoidia bacterium]
MHEMSIAQSIVDIVEKEMASHGVEQLKAVNISVGKWAAVVPEQLAFCFSMLTADTNMAGATLSIREVPLGYTCSGCGAEFTAGEMSIVCPRCGDTHIDLTSGRELSIESIEVAD